MPSMEELKKVCNTCDEEKPLSKFKIAWAEFHNHGGRYSGWAEANPLKARRKRCAACDSKSELAKLKLEMLAAFDYKCSCCGETHPDFLSLDHVNNDGAEHRKEVNCQQAIRQARREGWDKSKWDCLCMNCNFAKGHYGGCPHKTGLTAEMAIQRMQDRNLKIGRSHVDPRTNGSQVGFMKSGFDPRRMQLNRRVLKPCKTCGKEFGTNEMVRHRRAGCGQPSISIAEPGTPVCVPESGRT